ncbi:Ion transport protein-domain-containing protein [Halteromyces radiatus]|uniref:Ion transport protein-domain-containing protein n=1 Tax=Halteromyces radiatus TaxID=101107 RepID=UPI002220E745|nr:Ion transport protein-domain-containing protein [Halteromyces radiatus]KAI8096858.1 Ion transport protein-domain-containing protein [Halteromyces radiatus]
MPNSPQQQYLSSPNQSSNNPYKHVTISVAPDQDDSSSSTFMNFATKPVHSSNSTSLERSYTQRNPPVNVQDFRNAFEHAVPLPPKQDNIEQELRPFTQTSVSKQTTSQSQQSFEPSIYDSNFDDMDYSDTAKLTDNAAAITRDDQLNSSLTPMPPPSLPSTTTATATTTQIRRSYQPAAIEQHTNQNIGRLSLGKLLSDYGATFSLQLRNMSKRIINLENVSDTLLLPTPINIQENNTINNNKGTTSDVKHGDIDGNNSENIPMTSTRNFQTKQSTSTSTITTSNSFNSNNNRNRMGLSGKSCWLFGPDNSFRNYIAKILLWKWTETILMMVVILHGCVLLAAGWDNGPNPEPQTSWGTSWDQYVILSIFCIYTVYLLLRVVVFGFIFNNQTSQIQRFKPFLRHSWNRVDFISVVSYWIHFGLIISNQEIIDETRRITVFKMMSAIILMRLLNISKGNAVILHSLKKAAPLLVNVSFFVLFFFIIFAVIGVQSFKGSFLRHCVWTDPTNSTNTQELQQFCGGYIENGVRQPYIKLDGTQASWDKGFLCDNGLVCRETENPFGNTFSMDNVFSSMLMVLVITGKQSWTDRMYDMMDAEYFVACLYFIVIVIVMNFWLLNLFVAVINEMFAKVREDSQHSAFTTSKASTVLADVEGGWSFSNENIARTIRRSLLFEWVAATRPLWILLVVADLVVMAIKNNNMTEKQVTKLNSVEYGFSLAFMVEIFLRFISERQQLRIFFKDKANRADMIISIMSCIIWIPSIRNNPVAFAWLSGFPIMRIYRVLVAIPRLRRLIARVLGSVYGFINLIFFIILSTLICAIIAFQLLEGELNEADDEMRFFSVYNSFVALNQLFSGENWTTVLYNAMQYGRPSGNAAVNALFLSIWFAFSNFIMVNMFIAILMENFETAEEEKRQRQIQRYAEIHDSFDDNAEAIISRWNIYRYLRANPKNVAVKNIPANLTLALEKNDLKDFMTTTVDLENSTQNDKKLKWYGGGPRHRQQISTDSNKSSFRSFWNYIGDHISQIKHQPTHNTSGKSMQFDGQTTFDQLQTFYDINRNQDENAVNSLRYALAPSLRVNIAASVEESSLHDLEERRAMQRDFLRAHPSYDKSLFIFSPRHRIRYWCQLLVSPSHGERTFGTPPSRWLKLMFLSLVITCVITNVILTIYNSPVYQFEHRDDLSSLRPLIYADWAFTIVFTLEFLVKVIADGFIMTPNAYIMNGWNVLDLFVLVTLYMSNFGRFASSTGLERGFRAFKALRALRLINLLKPAKDMFTVILIQGLPLMLDAGALGLFLIVPFALYGKNIFMGLFYTCNDDSVLNKVGCINEAMLGTDAPVYEGTTILKPLVWSNPYVYSFDDFWSSLLILFEIASGEGWVDVMETSMSIAGKDLTQQQDASQLYAIFFMVYNLAGSVFVISLFLGIILENFAKRNGSAYLTAEQRRWLDLKKLLSQIRPAKRPKQIPVNVIRKKCFDLVVDKRGRFYKWMTAVIVLNILVLCTDTIRDDSLPVLKLVKEYVYLVFVLIYWFEVMVKLLGLGWTSFRRNLWNLYDLAVIIGSAVTVIFSLASNDHQVNVESQKLFMTALCFKLVQRSDALNQLFTTMAASAYQIANVFAVWFVVLTTYAIMFMEIFGLTKYGTQATTEHVNFRSYANTMVSLVRYSTGEGWNTVMHDFTVEAPQCQEADNYLDSDCGSLRWSYFLFLSLNIISMYIFTAVFVAVVSDNFSYVYQVAANFSLVNRDEIRKYPFCLYIYACKCWAEFDIERTGYIKVKDYMSFWRKLDGMFAINIYDDEFSYKNLVKACTLPNQADDSKDDRYNTRINLKKLNKILERLDRTTIHKRKHDMNMIYWETAMTESVQGVSFNQMLLMLAQRKLIVPENALLLEELLVNRKKEEAIHTLISIDRVKGLLETIALRKKFLRHMELKKQKLLKFEMEQKETKQLHIVPTTTGSPMAIESPLISPSLASLGYLSDENEPEVEWNSLAGALGHNPTDDRHELWHNLLQSEIKFEQ